MTHQPHVDIGVHFSYPVVFTDHVFDPANHTLSDLMTAAGAASGKAAPGFRVFVDGGLAAAQPELADAITAYCRHHLPQAPAEHPAILPGGETAKNDWQQIKLVIDEIAAHNLCRHSYVVAVGGGAFLDAVGFAAALVHRGLRLVRLPSTALAQDDSGVGTKNGINALGQKNYLGTFSPPFAVVNDFALLRTLPPDVVADGIAEAFKVAIIKDADFFDFLCDHAADLGDPEGDALREAVRRAAGLHMQHIMTSGDPFELCTARPLDFGHWAGHRLESMSDYQLRHGQGVAIGIALDSWYAQQQGLLAERELERILAGLEAAGLPTWHPLLHNTDTNGDLAVLDGIEQFREHLGGTLCVTLPDGIGNKVELSTLDRARIADGIEFLRARNA